MTVPGWIMLAAIAEVDRTTSLMDILSKQHLDTLRKMRLGFDARGSRNTGAYLLQHQRAAQGACVQPAPLDLNQAPVPAFA